jgi:hypothetical protein
VLDPVAETVRDPGDLAPADPARVTLRNVTRPQQRETDPAIVAEADEDGAGPSDDRHLAGRGRGGDQAVEGHERVLGVVDPREGRQRGDLGPLALEPCEDGRHA